MPQCYLRKYGESATVDFVLFEPDGVNLKADATFATGDVTLSLDEGTEANATNLPTDEGRGYSLVLTAAELQAARVVVYVVDLSGTKVWLDDALVIETYGHANAQHRFDLDAAALSAAEVNAEVDAALADYDGPTATELAARSLPADEYATASSQATILGRIGAFAGSGVNSILGFFLALLRSDASTPSDVGGSYSAAAHSLEALAASGGLGSGSGGSGNLGGGSGDYFADLLIARDNIARQLADLTAAPKPSYTIDGQTVSWNDHFRALSGELARLNVELQGAEPFEIHSSGYTG